MTLENTDKALSDIIDAINSRFPELAGKGFDALVEYVFVQSVVYASAFLIGVIVTALVTFWAFKKISRLELGDDSDFLFAFVLSIAGIFFITFFIGFVLSAPPIFSPEGAVIKQIIGATK